MNTHFTVVYDACVLYPAPLRDLLMRLALTDVFRARWTNQIHDEWIESVLRDRADIKREALEKTRTLMNSNVRDCLVAGHEYLIPSIELPDPRDRHVVAAAIHCGANLIVTANTRDFPDERLAPYKLEAQHPDDFIYSQFDLWPAAVVQAAADQRRALKNPPKSIDDFLDCLLKQGLPQTVDKLREFRLML